MNTSAQRRLYAAYQKLTGRLLSPFDQWGWDNGFSQRANTADGKDSIDLIGADSGNRLLLGGAYNSPINITQSFAITANAKLATSAFWVNNSTDTVEITAISCVYATADGAANTAKVTKEVTGQGPGTGTSCMTGTFDLNTTTNTVQNATLAGVRGYPSLVVNPGEQLSVKLNTTVTSLAGLVITVSFRPFISQSTASLALVANGDIVTQTIYLNAIPGQKVRAVAMRWGTAATDAGTMTATITKDTGTTAVGGGTAILAAAQSVKTTANTTVFPALSATASTLTMAIGDRLALKLSGSPTALANFVVTIFFESNTQNTIVVPLTTWDGASTSRAAFISNGYYTFVGVLLSWATASGTSGAVTATVDRGTATPGGGTALLTGTVSMTSTANTTNEGAPVVTTPSVTTIAPGDRVSLLFSGTANGTAGTVAALILRKA